MSQTQDQFTSPPEPTYGYGPAYPTSGYNGYAQPVPKRNTPLLVIGIILTVIGGLGTLGTLSMIGQGFLTIPRGMGPAYLVGRLTGVLIVVIMLVGGIIMISKSRRK